MDEDLVHSINSKYFEISELNNFKISKDTMSVFHMNIRSLSAHHDELSLLLAGLKFKFDVIGISETKGFFQMFTSLDIISILSQPKVQLVELHFILIPH